MPFQVIVCNSILVGDSHSHAQVTPENPMSVHELGFDSVWVHSGYFDIIQQTRALGRGHHGGAWMACMSMAGIAPGCCSSWCIDHPAVCRRRLG